MIAVTEEAKAFIASQETPEGTVLRLDPVLGGDSRAEKEVTLDFVAGEPKDDDQVVEHRGEEVLRISGPVSKLLDGGKVEVVVDDGPNANGSEGQILGIAVVPPSRATPPDAPLPDDS
ncbi:MAG: hypothetical protein M3R38_10330 [Actinomycetota bacterium]|nr:hypothetical protein [Actinomycetota bacterium]